MIVFQQLSCVLLNDYEACKCYDKTGLGKCTGRFIVHV